MGRKTPTRRLNLLGERVRAKESFNSDLVGISGTVVDETKNMLIVRDDSGRTVRIPKAVCIFEVGREDKVTIDGSIIVGRLERRLVGK